MISDVIPYEFLQEMLKSVLRNTENILESPLRNTMINTILIACFYPILTHFFLKTISKRYRSLKRAKQRNVISYIAELVVTSITLVIQVYGSWDIIFMGNNIEITGESYEESAKWLGVSLQFVTVLFVWELIYKRNFGWPLLCHHVLTLLGIQLVLATLRDSPSLLYLRCAYIMGFHATIDQPSYVALLLHNFKDPSTDTAFIVASIDRIIFRVALFVGGLYFYSTALLQDEFTSGDGGERTAWDKFWIISFVPLTITQSMVLFFQ